MPRPLASLPKTDRDIYAALAEEPLAPDTPLALADSAEEAMADHRAALLRRSRLALFELLRGKALTDAECAEALGDPKEQERRISRALGTPDIHALPDLRTPEGIRTQYEFQRLLLASLDLLEDHNGHPGVTGIDGKFHAMPPLEMVRQRLATPEMQQKIEQGFDQLLLVPFALPLHRLIEAWKQHLLRNEHLLQEHGGLDRNQPVWTWEESYGLREGHGPDEDNRLVYVPQRFAQNHGGRTKQQLLASRGASAGWRVLLVEGDMVNLPRAGEGKTVGGRAQVEAGRTPQEYLASLPAGESGWTPETYVIAFLTHLERTGRPLDAGTYTYLTASYLQGPGRVPCACWDSGRRQAHLGWYVPGYRYASGGARGAVGVV